MGHRRGTGRFERGGRAPIAVVLVVVAALGLGACGSSDDGAGKVDISGLDDSAPTTKGDGPDDTTTTEAASDATETTSDATEADGPDCGLLGDSLIPPVQLSEEDGGDPIPGSDSMSLDEEMAVSRSIGKQLPPEMAERWAALIDAVEAEAAGEPPLDDAEAQKLFGVYDEAIVWSARNCPDLPPTWACATQAKFQKVGEAIRGDGTVEYEEDGVEDPDDVLAGYKDAEDAVVLDESDTAILWGWLDEDGLVVRTEQANQTDGLWASDGASVSCQDDSTGGDSGSGSFATVGEPVDE